MLDDLKRESHAVSPGKDLFKLAVYVVGMLILGITIVAGTRCQGGVPAGEPSEQAPETDTVPETPPPALDPAALGQLVERSKAEPYRFASEGIDYIRDMQRDGVLPPVTGRLDPTALGALSPQAARGKRYEVTGRVVDVSREVYAPGGDEGGDGRLWSIVLEDEAGGQAVVLRYALGSEFEEGHPREAKPPRTPAAKIEPGQDIVARGVYLQQRTGTLGGTSLPKPAPVLFGGKIRITLPPSERSEPISGLDEALWGDVQDRYSRESRRWDEDAVFEVIQWARARGYDAVRKDIEDGTLPWKPWGAPTFERWKKEVSVATADTPRSFTNDSRGTIFRTDGIVGEVLQFGWERIPANRWGVDDFQVLTMLSDHYQHVAMRMFLPYPIETFPGVTGKRAEHLRVYGVFVKNDTYDTKFKREDGKRGSLPITAPMFVVLHIEPFPEGEKAEAMRTLMWWITGSMIIFGLLFYIVLIRGGSKQQERMEAHRIKLRQRMREKGQVPKIEKPGLEADPPPDGEPEA